ncbi:MAG: hypothetical protein WBI91_08530 [Coriobacteriia bacterium]
MADLLVRNVPASVMERLKAQAQRNGRSVQKEALAILDGGTQLTMEEWLEQAAAHREQLRADGYTGDSTAMIREDRDTR